LDENEDDDAVKRQRKGEGEIILDHGSDIPQVEDDITATYVLCAAANYDILNGSKFLSIDLIILDSIIYVCHHV
jgi:hypothetical protein